MKLSIVDIDWIVKENNRLLKSRYRLSKYQSIGLDWIGIPGSDVPLGNPK